MNSPSQSFILDPSDSTYVKNGMFSEEEIEEIKHEKKIIFEDVPREVVEFLEKFECVRNLCSDMLHCDCYQMLTVTMMVHDQRSEDSSCGEHALVLLI